MHSTGPLTVLQDRNVTIVEFGPQLKQITDLNISELGEKLFDIAEKLPRPLLILDMRQTEFFGSSFIEVLLGVWKRLSTASGAQLGIAGLRPYCREIFRVTQLDSIWQMYDSTQSASDNLNQIELSK